MITHCTCLTCGYKWQPMVMIGRIECPYCADLEEGFVDDEYLYEPFKDTRDGRSL